MKRSLKRPEPASLAQFRAARPQDTWEQMKQDPHHGGQQAYIDIKRELVRGQRGLCAFCERRITTGLTNAELDASKSRQRVEHFHPKSDLVGLVNWALHWPNLWAVCTGGNQAPPDGEPANPEEYLEPIPENLSCDAFKDRQIATHQIPLAPEGWILAPDEVPAFPRLFKYQWDGSIEPDPTNCLIFVPLTNQHADAVTLAQETIKHLNLNCNRLLRLRDVVRKTLEHRIQQLRNQHPAANPQTLIFSLAQRLLTANPNSCWPAFFTLIRWRLGAAAEQHLQQIGFNG